MRLAVLYLSKVNWILVSVTSCSKPHIIGYDWGFHQFLPCVVWQRVRINYGTPTPLPSFSGNPPS